MTLTNMRTTIKELLAVEGASSMWEDATLNRMINLAQVWVAASKPWRILMTAKTLDDGTVAYQNYYDLPSDYLYGSAFFVKIDTVDYNWVDELVFRASDFNTENSYTIHGTYFFIYETPSTASLVIDMYYHKRPVVLSEDTDESILQEELHEAILQRTLYLCLKRDKKVNAALESNNDAKEIIKEVWEMDKKNFRGPKTIKSILDNFPNYSCSGN